MDSINNIYTIEYKDRLHCKIISFNFNETIDITLSNRKYLIQKYNPKESDLYFRIINKKALMMSK